MADNATDDGVGAKRHRSPNFPMFSLPKAIERAKKLFGEMQRHAVGSDIVIKKLGYAPKSSSGLKALAAMRAFGLLVDVRGAGDNQVRFSEVGLDIVADYKEGDEQHTKAIRHAALMPPLHKELWNKYDGKIPPDDELRRYLVRVRDQKFNENSVDDFIAEFKLTIAYAKLTETAKIPDGDAAEGDATGEEDEADDSTNPPPPLKKDRPAKERRIMPAGTKEDVFTLDEGPVVLQWPDRISPTSAQDLEDWLALIIRKAKRQAEADENQSAEGEAGDG